MLGKERQMINTVATRHISLKNGNQNSTKGNDALERIILRNALKSD